MVVQELLEFVAAYHMLLDPINLVTCLYRLAKMSFYQKSRTNYLTELQQSETFQLLLRKHHQFLPTSVVNEVYQVCCHHLYMTHTIYCFVLV